MSFKVHQVAILVTLCLIFFTSASAFLISNGKIHNYKSTSVIMGAKRVQLGDKSRNKLVEGINLVNSAVKVTLGPKGKNVVLQKKINGQPEIVNDGVTIAKDIESSDPEINVGVRLMQEVARKSDAKAGDGTTTSTVLTAAMVNEGLKLVNSGVNGERLCSGMRRAAALVVNELANMAEQVKTQEDLYNIAWVATSGNEDMAKVIAEAYGKIMGKSKEISESGQLLGSSVIEEGNKLEDELIFSEGLTIDRGYGSPYFIKDTDRMNCELVAPRVLVVGWDIQVPEELVPVCEMCVVNKEPLVIIAEDVIGDALALLVVNKLRGLMDVTTVKAPFYGERRTRFMEDICLATGATLISNELGMTLDQIKIEHLGRAERVVSNRESTTIVTHEIYEEVINARISQLRHELAMADNVYDEEKLQHRLGALSGGIARIKVGAATETELKDKKLRYEDALNSVKSGIITGVLPGGGSSLVYVAKQIESKISEHFDNPEELKGAQLLLRALRKPIAQMVENCGLRSPGSTVLKVEEKNTWGYGYNGVTDTFENLLDSGILDSAGVVIHSIQNSASIASSILTTECMVSESPEGEIPKFRESEEEASDYVWD